MVNAGLLAMFGVGVVFAAIGGAGVGLEFAEPSALIL